MYQIALCDDEPTELHTMERMLRSYPGHSIKDTLAVRQFERADDHEGIGVKSIQSTAAKYDGSAEFYEKGGLFICRVLLNARKDS